MARIRTIKPEFFTDEDMVDMTPLARLLYIALWCEADREGRLEWKLKTLKWKYLPADDCDIQCIAKELTDAGKIVTYTAEDGDYAVIPAFNKHQHINTREAASKLPAPTGSKRVRARATTVQEPAIASEPTDLSRGEGEGRELEGKEKESPSEGIDFGLIFDEQIWPIFPSRGQATNPKKPAREKFVRLCKSGTDPEEIIAGVKAYAANPTTKHGTEFVKTAEVWLNKECWKEAVEIASAPPAPVIDDEIAQHRIRTTVWMGSKKHPDERYWDADHWGPPPHHLDTWVPRKILDETGACNVPPPVLDRSRSRNLTMAG